MPQRFCENRGSTSQFARGVASCTLHAGTCAGDITRKLSPPKAYSMLHGLVHPSRRNLRRRHNKQAQPPEGLLDASLRRPHPLEVYMHALSWHAGFRRRRRGGGSPRRVPGDARRGRAPRRAAVDGAARAGGRRRRRRDAGPRGRRAVGGVVAGQRRGDVDRRPGHVRAQALEAHGQPLLPEARHDRRQEVRRLRSK